MIRRLARCLAVTELVELSTQRDFYRDKFASVCGERDFYRDLAIALAANNRRGTEMVELALAGGASAPTTGEPTK